jgi:hypothetical protein
MTVVQCTPIPGTDQCAAAFDTRPWEELAAWTLELDQTNYVYIPVCSFSVPGNGLLTPLLSPSTPNPMFLMLMWDCGGAQGLSLDPALVLYEQSSRSYVNEVEYSGMTNHLFIPIDGNVGTYCKGTQSLMPAPVDLSPLWYFDEAKPTTYTWYLRLYSSQPITQNLFVKTAGPWGFVFTPTASLSKQEMKLLKDHEKLRKKEAEVRRHRRTHALQVHSLVRQLSLH